MDTPARSDHSYPPDRHGQLSSGVTSERHRRRYLLFRRAPITPDGSAVERTVIYARDLTTGQLRHLELLRRRAPQTPDSPPDNEPPPAAAVALQPDAPPLGGLGRRAA